MIAAALLAPLALAVDISGPGSSLRGPIVLRADGRIGVGRSIYSVDRGMNAVRRIAERARRAPRPSPIEVRIEFDAPQEPAGQVLALMKEGRTSLAEDAISFEGDAVTIASELWTVRFIVTRADAASAATVAMALNQVNERRQALAQDYRRLAGEGRQQGLEEALMRFRTLTSVYQSLYRLQRSK